MKRHTKIVATLGPSSQDSRTLTAMVKAGMNIARLNGSHGSFEQFNGMVLKLRAIEKKSGKIILTLLDLQGPKIRLGEIPESGIEVKKGQTLSFHTGKNLLNGKIPIPYPALPKVVKAGQSLLIEDGIIRTKILSIKGGIVTVKVLTDGTLKRHKGVNLPEAELPPQETLSKKDRADLEFGVKKLKVDAVALSFVETPEDLTRVRALIQKWTKRHVLLIAKIERPKALVNLKAIAKAADGLMVARGDLGIEIPAEQVPLEQRRILAVGRELGKPVIVATQVLESMVDNPLPTRAEMSDAATAIFEKTDALMLSNESAVGKYPVEAVRTLASVAETVEAAMSTSDFRMQAIDLDPLDEGFNDHHLAKEAIELAEDIDAKTLVVVTEHGYTARAVLRLRPKIAVTVLTVHPETARELQAYWGAADTLICKGPLDAEGIKKCLRRKKIRGTVVTLSLNAKKRSLVVMDI